MYNEHKNNLCVYPSWPRKPRDEFFSFKFFGHFFVVFAAAFCCLLRGCLKKHNEKEGGLYSLDHIKNENDKIFDLMVRYVKYIYVRTYTLHNSHFNFQELLEYLNIYFKTKHRLLLSFCPPSPLPVYLPTHRRSKATPTKTTIKLKMFFFCWCVCLLCS